MKDIKESHDFLYSFIIYFAFIEVSLDNCILIDMEFKSIYYSRVVSEYEKCKKI